MSSVTERKGRISVNTENIFPIIKKSLYSEHEIFLRELVSNAVDATQKLKTIASLGEVKGELGDLKVRVKLDADAKTLTISDSGIGMTAEEVDKYINQIAFSGATEFLHKYEGKTGENAIIGHFGLGFYSAFMVADSVEIQTLSHVEGATPVRWFCEGSTEFELSDGTRTERGTDMILHLAADSEEFLSEARITELLEKYCKFLPVEIAFGTEEVTRKNEQGEDETVTEERIINGVKPLWTRKPNELSDEDYLKFYEDLYPFSEKPLFWIHLNVDYPFNLTGILYFPKIKDNFEVQKNKIQLYCNQVFVTDSVENIVPDFLRLLHGVLDSPDIPLNVSRSYLQGDPNVKKISAHITKKVADKLDEIFRKDRISFEEKWNNLALFVKYGMLSEEKFYEKAQKFCLYETVDSKYFTIEEYKEHIQTNQTDKDQNLVALYTNDSDAQNTFIQAARKRHYDVLKMPTIIDSHFIQFVEMKQDKLRFKRVDSDTIDKLIDKEEQRESLLNDEQVKQVESLVSEVTGDNKLFSVSSQALSPDDAPILITRSEWMRRMKEQAQTGGGMYAMMGEMPENHQVVVNTCHPYIQKIVATQDTERQEQLARQAFDLALLSQGLLKGDALTSFIERSIELV